MFVRRILLPTLVAFVGLLLVIAAGAQSLVSGDVTGVVTDPSGAVLPNVTVTLKSGETGAVQTRVTNAQGVYRFSLLSPGTYTISVAAKGFQPIEKQATVSVGEATTAHMQLALATAATTVEVTAGASVVQTENANVSTTFSPEQIAEVPNPGNDLSYIVQTAPGATMNTQAGYGNSATYGISATSNLFTVNGMNENDPFLNLNNSGATNLLLGQNDVHEATVVNNGYSAQYGGLAGANVNYVTKSGSNAWHGNALYWWDGRAMNANDYFNNRNGVKRPFVNANQWATSLGGPIVKDKTFFFADYEGLRLVLPTAQQVVIPSPDFQTSTLANLAAGPNAAEIPFYNHIFSLFNNAPGANKARPLPGGSNGCSSGFSLPDGGPCALQFQSTAGNFTHEWLLTGRVDQNIDNNDRAFVHFRTDHGLQATYTDPLTPILNAQSDQPQYEGQFQENHTFGSNSVNQFILAGSWYSAIFKPKSITAALQTLPFEMNFNNAFYTMGGAFYNTWPQGRNVSQYQLLDDYSWLRGKHSLKFGVNFRRNDITDYTPGGFLGTIPEAIFNSQASFYNGTADVFEQAFPTRATQPLALYGLGLYAQDEWALTPKLKITLGLRGEHNSNPICQTNCFARLANSFLDVSHNINQPYDQAIRTGLHEALANYTNVEWEPRFGFAWQPFGDNTVIRGGIGIFADIFPATVATNFDTNSPLKNTFIPVNGAFAPGLPNNLESQAVASNAAFVQGFKEGLTYPQIVAMDPLFTAPAFYNAAHMIHTPQYQEWNLELQQGIGQKVTASVNYVGNHGIYEAVQNAGFNAFGFSGFASLPSVAPDPRFSTVTEATGSGVSNYNGLTLSLRRRFSQVQLQANYTWSHALDEISNAGFLPYNFKTNTSVLAPQDPFNLRKYNYGNADYDTRHYFSLNYVWDTPWRRGWLGAVGDWTVSGTIFARTGLPFTVIDSANNGTLLGQNYGNSGGGPSIFANYLGGAPNSCGTGAVTKPCLTTAEFSSASTGFGDQRRNQFYGPGFFDTDLTVMKNFAIPRWETAKFSVGIQAFNLFNHPNFDQPIADVANPQLGSIVQTVGTPTSILGSFLGGDASPRLIQLKASLNF
jgi:hypothetical protein